jgi:hypothetical protein
MSMTTIHRVLPRDVLLDRYLEALDRRGDKDPDDDVRTCARCGESAPFTLDPDGGWAYCGACGLAA